MRSPIRRTCSRDILIVGINRVYVKGRTQQSSQILELSAVMCQIIRHPSLFGDEVLLIYVGYRVLGGLVLHYALICEGVVETEGHVMHFIS